ncbi:ATP-binding protein [Ramlibacter sp.]|uniref:ATP-binding protein n=1 Tax=Ramlibacter sp. TaxID=1917967 RepID=UPI0035B17BF3
MRLRIFHQIFLLLAGMAVLSAAAIGGWFAWNLKAGFSDYLRSRDNQQLARFAEVVAQRVDWTARAGSAQRLPMRELMDEFMTREGLAPPPDWRLRQGGGPPPAGEPPGRSAAGVVAPPPRPRPPPPPPPSPGGLAQRIQVVSPQGAHLGGPQFPQGRSWLSHPVRVGGETVAYVRMLPTTEMQDVDARFLQRQYTGLAIALLATLVIAFGAAALAARRIGGPLLSVQRAAQRIAGGELGVQVPVAGSREMAALIGDVNRMAATLQQLEGARRRWIAQISHELRTPLSVLLGELEAMQEGVRQPTPQMLETLRGEAAQLVRLVNDLHTLSVADLGTLPCSFADVNAGRLLAGLMERHVPRLQAAGLSVDVHDGANPRACWDAGRIEQLVTNLLTNSQRYTQAPGQVLVRWDRVGESLRLVVEDSPPGVPEETMEQLFEPLFRVDPARQRQRDGQTGSGLGLAICRAIVQAHGGEITAQPSLLGGLAVTVTLPLVPEAAA